MEQPGAKCQVCFLGMCQGERSPGCVDTEQSNSLLVDVVDYFLCSSSSPSRLVYGR